PHTLHQAVESIALGAAAKERWPRVASRHGRSRFAPQANGDASTANGNSQLRAGGGSGPRRRVGALADAWAEQPDRRAWHLAESAVELDESVAAQLEAATAGSWPAP